MPEEDEETGRLLMRMRRLKGLSGNRLQKEAKDIARETIEPLRELHSMREPQSATTSETSFTEEIVDSPRPIDRLIDATDDELRSLGFTEYALRELRGLVKSGVDLATVKRDKDMLIEELEKGLVIKIKNY